MQLVSRFMEAAQPGGRLEAAQHVQGRPLLEHINKPC
jgi:hypothetical protein